jgi:hypothetical protein
MYQNYIETMKQALVALEDRHMADDQTLQGKAITALRLAIEQVARQKPVAYLDEGLGTFYWPKEYKKDVGFTPLYTVPPQRQPLTEEQIDAIGSEWVGYPSYDDEFRWFAREIERKHGIGVDQ